MNILEVRYTLTAEEEMFGVWKFVAKKHGHDRADSLIDRIQERCQKLGRSPLFGRPYPRRPDMRYFSFLSHHILYVIHIDFVEVCHIVHTARDLNADFDSLE